VTGIALQTWDRHGWGGSWIQKYWLWRDRKGLLGNPLSLLTNVLFAYGLMSLAAAQWLGVEWHLGRLLNDAAWLFACSSVLSVYRLAYRAVWSGRHFGWAFALATPPRVIWANVINTVATLRAIRRFAASKLRGEPLVWVKTDHQYPSAVALATARHRLGEVLVAGGYVSEAVLCSALASRPAEVGLGEHLVNLGWLDEKSLYEVLSRQHGLPQSRIDPDEVRPAVARAFPMRVLRHWRVLPFKVEAGKLFVAAPDPPTPEMRCALRPLTRLELEFHLVTPANYRSLTEALL
jgi:adsorption protein B